MSGKEEEKFYLHINGESVRVSREVYRVYKNAEEKERYFMKRLKKGRFTAGREGQGEDYIPSREKSFEKLIEEGWEFAGTGEGVEDVAVRACLAEELGKAVQSLPEEDRILVEELFYLEKTEREVCGALHMAKTTLNRRKQDVLKKLREQIGN